MKVGWLLEADPLLTQAPAERFVETDMASGDHPSGFRIVDQVSVCVSGVAQQDALEGGICHLAPLFCGDVNVGRTSKNSQVA